MCASVSSRGAVHWDTGADVEFPNSRILHRKQLPPGWETDSFNFHYFIIYRFWRFYAGPAPVRKGPTDDRADDRFFIGINAALCLLSTYFLVVLVGGGLPRTVRPISVYDIVIPPDDDKCIHIRGYNLSTLSKISRYIIHIHIGEPFYYVTVCRYTCCIFKCTMEFTFN